MRRKNNKTMSNLYKIEFEKGIHKSFSISAYFETALGVTFHIEYRWFKYAYLFEFIFLNNENNLETQK